MQSEHSDQPRQKIGAAALQEQPFGFVTRISPLRSICCGQFFRASLDLAVKRQKEVESGRTAKLLDPANPKVHLDTVQKRPPR